MNNENEVASIPLAALESASERSQRIIRTLAVGWAVSILALAAPLAYVLLA